MLLPPNPDCRQFHALLKKKNVDPHLVTTIAIFKLNSFIFDILDFPAVPVKVLKYKCTLIPEISTIIKLRKTKMGCCLVLNGNSVILVTVIQVIFTAFKAH